jgi:Icc-related predicted phosphoesterase
MQTHRTNLAQAAPLGLSVVCLSDTHGGHRTVEVPPGDFLVHAGDFTRFGREADALDFNLWLGELPHKYKIVVLGNHECNTDWAPRCKQLFTNATFLCNESCELEGLKIFGSQFYWEEGSGREAEGGNDAAFDKIPLDTDILIAHNPPLGLLDHSFGCSALRRRLEQLHARPPRLVVSGHIHAAHGISAGPASLTGTVFVNAANCGNGYKIAWPPIVVEI